MALIVYTSNSGSTERYAKMLSEKTGFDAVPLSEAPDEATDVIYFGWIMAGEIQGLKKAREKFSPLKAVCAVGLFSPDEKREEISQKNNITEPLFVLQGEFNVNKLKGIYKMIMVAIMKKMKEKLTQSDDPNDMKAAQFIENGIDMVKEESLDEIIEFLK